LLMISAEEHDGA